MSEANESIAYLLSLARNLSDGEGLLLRGLHQRPGEEHASLGDLRALLAERTEMVELLHAIIEGFGAESPGCVSADLIERALRLLPPPWPHQPVGLVPAPSARGLSRRPVHAGSRGAVLGQLSMNPAPFIVRCGDCDWQGPSSQLSSANGLRYCPKCGQEFGLTPVAPQNEWIWRAP